MKQFVLIEHTTAKEKRENVAQDKVSKGWLKECINDRKERGKRTRLCFTRLGMDTIYSPSKDLFQSLSS